MGKHIGIISWKEVRLDFGVTPRIPEDAAVLIIAGPQQPLARRELAMVQGYLETGGCVFLLLNPNPPQAFKQWLTSARSILADRGGYG